MTKIYTPILKHYLTRIKIKNFIDTVDFIDEIAKIIIDDLNYNIVGKLSHSFTPIGKTVVCILSESHLSIHTWPEYNMIYIDLASCKEISDEQIENTFEKAFEKYEIEPFEIKNVVL